MLLEPEPAAAAAPLVLAGDQPHPLDGRVTLLARAADHSVLRGEAAGSHSISVIENENVSFNSYVQAVPSACTEFPIPSFMISTCFVLGVPLPCMGRS